MIRPSLFRNYILLSIFVTLGIFVAGASLTQYLTHLRREKMEPPPNMILFTAKIMEEFVPGEPLKSFQYVKKAIGTDNTRVLWLVGPDGKVIDSTDAMPLPVDWTKIEVPKNTFDRTRFGGPTVNGTFGSPSSASPFAAPGGGAPGRPGPPPAEIIRLQASTPMFLVSEFKPRVSTGSEFYILQLSLLASIIVASLITFALISWHLRSKALVAEQVMTELRKGNLKARFPIKKNDEIGRIMTLFNHMSDEIERLVEKIRYNEQSRMFILQELAHDLRTPIASLRSMIETLREGEGKIPAKISEELFQMSLEEVSYFNRLVEDLLLLAQVLEPAYHSPHQNLAWQKLLEEEIDKFQAQQGANPNGKQIQLKTGASFPPSIRGDEHLLRRVFKNILQNALTFANYSVTVETQVIGDKVKIIFQDDGPGFSPEVLSSYGERRFSRFINPQNGVHLSVGLGAVIVKKVIAIHQGEVEIQNSGKGTGAEVILSLPAAVSV